MADKVLVDVDLQKIICDELQRSGRKLPAQAWDVAGDIAAAIAASAGVSLSSGATPIECAHNFPCDPDTGYRCSMHRPSQPRAEGT